MNEILIRDRKVGDKHQPWIVAEMSGNHNQSLERALQIVEAAANAGAHALKIQTYTADTLTINVDSSDFLIGDSKSLWKGESLYSLYQKAFTPWEWHRQIFKRCHELGLICFSSPFDETAVDFLETLGCPCYKIASFENIHLPLIRKAASTGKPLIISTGMANISELDEMVKAARESGCQNLILLKCTSSYPASPLNSNLKTIPHLRDLFNCQVGLSDHTLGIGAGIASVALGATVIEKHFTLSRKDGGVDAAFSLEPAEIRSLVDETKRAWESLGRVVYGPTAAEEKSKAFRRSLYIVKDIKGGEVLSKENLRIIRPGYGLAPKYFDIILGRRAKNAIKAGTPLSWELVF